MPRSDASDFGVVFQRLRDVLAKHATDLACFNFTATDPALFKEIAALTATSIAAFKKAGFIS